jgi:hypothetical protein
VHGPISCAEWRRCALRFLRRSAGARFILVVEKDAVFQSLVESRLHQQLPCILITGGRRNRHCHMVREVEGGDVDATA